jgi:hypothetical protein
MDNQEKEFLDDVDTDIDTSFRKPKKQLSDKNYNIYPTLESKHLKRKTK